MSPTSTTLTGDHVLRCHRCLAGNVAASIEVFSIYGDGRRDLCPACARSVVRFLLDGDMTVLPVPQNPAPLPTWSDIDDAEHPAWCVCDVCDPDTLADRLRDERFTA